MKDEILKKLVDKLSAEALDLRYIPIEGTLDDIVEILNGIRALGLGTSVRSLRLSSNGLTDLPEDIFQGLTALQYLYLEKNQLSRLPKGLFQGLTELRWIDLSENQLSSLPGGLFQGLSNSLRTLHLTQNQLSTLPDCFKELTALKNLDLSYNRFGVFPLELLEDLALWPGYPILTGNFNFGPEGEIQVPLRVSRSGPVEVPRPDVKVVFDRIVAEYDNNLDVLDQAAIDAYPNLTFSFQQIEVLAKARTMALKQKTMLFQYIDEQGFPREIGNLILSLTGHYFKSKPNSTLRF